MFVNIFHLLERRFILLFSVPKNKRGFSTWSIGMKKHYVMHEGTYIDKRTPPK